jgi:dimethylhistidine N-methyltransferase
MSPASRTATALKRIGEVEFEFPDALLAGLLAEPKHIACKYFYDAEGAKLFQRICTLPEYYLTRTERALLRDHADDIGRLIGPDAEIVEFGAGSSDKIALLLAAVGRPSAYVPIDISRESLDDLVARVRRIRPELSVNPLLADFSAELPASLFSQTAHRRVGFFPGSTIGNFTPDEARTFLTRAARLLSGGGLLIGVDRVKDPQLLHAAYNDSAGVTAAFNRNLLLRANREASASFDIRRFAHYAPYNVEKRRVEMYLVSTVAQRVRVCGRTVVFNEGEPIHTEWSHKYTVDDFRALASEAGFLPRAVWCDPDRLFSIHWLEAR